MGNGLEDRHKDEAADAQDEDEEFVAVAQVGALDIVLDGLGEASFQLARDDERGQEDGDDGGQQHEFDEGADGDVAVGPQQDGGDVADGAP